MHNAIEIPVPNALSELLIPYTSLTYWMIWGSSKSTVDSMDYKTLSFNDNYLVGVWTILIASYWYEVSLVKIEVSNLRRSLDLNWIKCFWPLISLNDLYPYYDKICLISEAILSLYVTMSLILWFF